MLTLGRVASRLVQVWSRMQQVLVQKVWVGFSTDFPREARGQRPANSVAWSSNGPFVVGGTAYFSFSFSLSFSYQAHQQLAFGLNCVGAVKGVAQRLPRWIQS
jgi:hypothetical protein